MGEVNGGHLVVRALKREGVEYIFSLSGGHIDPIYQACLDEGIKVIDTRHEQAAAHMAEAWGRLNRKPGVCVVTAGPGFTDAITGVANAWESRTPMIFISGRSAISQTETLALQELEQIDIIRPFIKWGRVAYETHRLDEFTAIAFRHATTGRPGVSFLEIPMDVMYKTVDEKTAVEPEGYRPRYQPGGAEKGLRAATKLLREAQKPAIIIGSGAYYAHAEEELKAFCELADIPVFNNLMGRGMLRGCDIHNAGFAMASSETLAACDLIFILGSRLGLFLNYGGSTIFSPEAKVIQVDIDGEEIGRNRKIDVGIVGDVKEVLRGLTEIIYEKPYSHSGWLETVSHEVKTARKNMLKNMLTFGEEEPIHPARLMGEINAFLDNDAVVVADGGDTSVWTLLTQEPYEPGHFLVSGGFGCLGVGIPYGLAAKLRYPDKQVLVTMGDGSAGLNLMEFNTAVRFNLPIVMVISNDCSWGMIRHGQEKIFGSDRVVGCELGEVAYEKVVEALGGYGERVTKAKDIKPALERAFASNKPACLNVFTDPAVGSPTAELLAELRKS
ncbi:MAG: thiamine pyrophosphate-binding protein [Deltaproteobacteria bacterium]|nr:thiamine pyrophosphate-binding protein [Deltaproteobacteria bacterium]MBW2053148.1 thiamine pyrophosphate-binding protein [Deltaproteobacteria bacterium]MBW2141597.1 thiamine pyrophosphate-binding protein [Deltaproteobacteria bacterium]MBW2324552.1 thiamine pyrophosphate-binding protein [Deltaproteobacteria bacterium]